MTALPADRDVATGHERGAGSAGGEGDDTTGLSGQGVGAFSEVGRAQGMPRPPDSR